MRNFHSRFVWLAACVIGLCLVVSGATAADTTDKSDDPDAEYYELMKVFVDTFEQIDRNYVKSVNRRQLMEAAIEGMIDKLDPYSSYINREEISRFNEEVEQEFGGIGIQVHIDPDTKRLAVMTPLPGTPAYKAGVRAGDLIMEIEGQDTKGYTLNKAVKILKGKPGESVTIGVKHFGSDDVEQVTIVRDVIQVATVLGDKYGPDGKLDFMLDPKNKIGYIRLTHFGRHSAEELSEALKTLSAEHMKGLILDLRFNPGGLLSQAVEIADLFIDKGTIVSTNGRNVEERVWEAKPNGTYSGFPMAVLVNRYSASASEIVSACLQDHHRAVIVGERTWGKGSVQNVIELEDGQSALKLTTASYHRPSGKNIHRFPDAKESDEWGVMPDNGFAVKMSLQELQDYLEYRRDRDVISKDGPPEGKFEDRQLAKALRYLRGELNPVEAAKPVSPRSPVEAPKPDGTGKSAAQAPQVRELFFAVSAAA